MVHMIDGLDLGMGLHRDRVEAAHLAHLHEGGLQLGQRLHAGIGAHVLVLGEDRHAVDVPNGEHGAGEAAFVPGHRRALLALDRIGVDVGAREAVFGGDEIGRNALRHEIGLERDRRIDRPGAAGGADADAAHGFDAAADRHVVLAGHDLRGREVDGIEPGGAEAVDLHARNAVAVAGHEGGGARDVAARLAHRIDATQYHVVDQLGVEGAALLDGGERLGGEIERRHLVQGAVDLAAPARGAQMIVDERVSHRASDPFAVSRKELPPRSSLRTPRPAIPSDCGVQPDAGKVQGRLRKHPPEKGRSRAYHACLRRHGPGRAGERGLDDSTPYSPRRCVHCRD